MRSTPFSGPAIGRRTALMSALAVLAFLASTPALAAVGTPLLPNTTVAPVPVVALPAGAIVAGSAGTIASVGNNTVFSTLFQAVYRETATGTLDFLFQIRNDSPIGGTNLVALSTSDYGAGAGVFDTNAAQLSGAGPAGFPVAVPAGTVSAGNASRGPSGTTVTFDGFVLAPGQTSQIFIVSTNATNFNQLGVSTASSQIIGGNNPGADSFLNTNEPTLNPVVPEPASLISGSLAVLAGLGCFGWRRLKASKV